MMLTMMIKVTIKAKLTMMIKVMLTMTIKATLITMKKRGQSLCNYSGARP